MNVAPAPAASRIAEYLDLDASCAVEIHRLITDTGMPSSVLDAARARLGLSQRQMAAVLLRRSVSAWRSPVLPPVLADRLCRVAMVAIAAEDALGSAAEASAWLRGHDPDLGGPRYGWLTTTVGTEYLLARLAGGSNPALTDTG